MRLTTLPGLALLATIALPMLAPPPAAAVDPGSELITCDRADERVDITVSSHLDPSCTWTRGCEILASNVTLDCQGAHIAAPDRRYGVYIHAPTDTPLTNITVRNCHVEGFLNNFHIEREGFRQLAEGVEYENGFSNITIEDSTSLNSRGVGIFVNGYVEGVTLRNLHVEGASSAGIYLEAGSKNCVVENSTIVNNGFGENSPAGGDVHVRGHRLLVLGHRTRGPRDRRVPLQHRPEQHLPEQHRRRHLPLQELRRVRDAAAGALVPPPLRRRRQRDREQHLHRRGQRRVDRVAHGREHAADGVQRSAVRRPATLSTTPTTTSSATTSSRT